MRPRWPLVSELYEVIQSCYALLALIQVFRNPRQPQFIVTPKGELLDEDFISPMVKPFYYLIAFLGISLGFGVWRFDAYPLSRGLTTAASPGASARRRASTPARSGWAADPTARSGECRRRRAQQVVADVTILMVRGLRPANRSGRSSAARATGCATRATAAASARAPVASIFPTALTVRVMPRTGGVFSRNSTVAGTPLTWTSPLALIPAGSATSLTLLAARS